MSTAVTGPVLFVAPTEADYLSVCLLHGLRRLQGENVIDYPRYDVAYDDFPLGDRERVYGRGFSVFFLLPNARIDRTEITAKIARGYFRWIIFPSIHQQFGLFLQWRPWLFPENTVVIDGADTAHVYPHDGRWWRRRYYWWLPRATHGYLYFKREWTEDSQFNLWHRLVPHAWRKRLPHYRNLRRISFSVPEEKIVREFPTKTKQFAKHLVDPEVAAQVSGSQTSYAFQTEADYYADLQASRFCVTTKRAGWDCLRHYEIAANACVPCFRDLHLKPSTCAPHGLVSGTNCISYATAEELFTQVSNITEMRYLELLQGVRRWVAAKATTAQASFVTDEWQRHRSRCVR